MVVQATDNDAFSQSNFLSRSGSTTARRKLRKGVLVLNATHRFQQQLGPAAADVPTDPCDPGTRCLRILTFVFRAVIALIKCVGQDDGQDDLHLALNITERDSVSVDKLTELLQAKSVDQLRDLGGPHGVAESLGTDLRTGLGNDPCELEGRRSLYGSNSYRSKSIKPFWRCVWEAAHDDATLIVLMVLALLSIVFGTLTQDVDQGWYQDASIAGTILIMITITAISNYWQSCQLRVADVEKMKNTQVQVIRSSCPQPVSIFDLVVGDVVQLNTGNVVPSNGLLIEGQSLTVNEASLTGESNAIDVDDESNPFLLSGCKVTSGHGTMLVTGVGTNTEWGKIMFSLTENRLRERPTPLQDQLRALSTFLNKIGIPVSFLTLLVLLLHNFIGTFDQGVNTPINIVYGVIQILIKAIINTTVVLPRGLSLAMTVTLAYSTKKMMAGQALVRHFSACETMGFVTTICTDKTGTLTLNQMTVVESWMAGDMWTKSQPTNIAPPCSRLLEGIALNSSCTVYIPPNGGPTEVTGSPTEKATLNWGLDFGMDYQLLHQALSVVQREVFDSEKKCAGVAIRSGDATIHVHWKGAAEIILGLCTKFYATNREIAMSMEKRGEIQETINRMAASSLRCIAFAYRPLQLGEEPAEETGNWKLPEDELSLLAIVGMKDTCRPGVSEAINECQKAGIVVRMITGDHLATSVAIAQECGILTREESLTLNPSSAIEGTTFSDWSQEERISALSHIKVMVRSSPNHKRTMVETLQKKGEIVAAMGDGTNDALALQEADVGLTMGTEDTEVTKNSSDIIILDNFKTIVHIVRWGRSIYANIQKFFQFQLTNSVAFLIVSVIAIVSKRDMPLTVVQSFWLDVVMDFVGPWALTTEHPTNELMHNPPVALFEPLVTNIMWRNIFGQAAYQIAIFLTLQFRGKQILNIQDDKDDILLTTITFNAFVLCQVFNMVNARRPTRFNIFEGLHKCHLFLGIIGVTLVLQVIIVELLGKFASTTNLKWNQWLTCVAIGSLSWPIDFVCKFIPIPKRHFLNINGLMKTTKTNILERSIELFTEEQNEQSTMPM